MLAAAASPHAQVSDAAVATLQVWLRMLTYADVCLRMLTYGKLREAERQLSASTSIRQHTSAYVSIRQRMPSPERKHERLQQHC